MLFNYWQCFQELPILPNSSYKPKINSVFSHFQLFYLLSISLLSVPMNFPILYVTSNWIFIVFVLRCLSFFTSTACLKIVHIAAGIRIPFLWLYNVPLYIPNTFCLCINFPDRHLGCFCLLVFINHIAVNITNTHFQFTYGYNRNRFDVS